MSTKTYTLDPYEQEIQDYFDMHYSLDADVHMTEENAALLKNLKKSLQEKHTKRRSISIRPLEHDIETIKIKAMEEGIPYQTLMNSILHKYATGKLIEK